jgi:hypothetical protein
MTPALCLGGRVLRRGHLEERRRGLGSNVRCEPITSRFPALSCFAHFSKFFTGRIGIRAGVTEEDIATAHRYAEASREALAKYDRRK